MRYASVVENAILVAVATCVVVLTAINVHRYLEQESARPSHFSRNWRQLREGGAIEGPSDAPLRLVVFSDYGCPCCRQAYVSLRTLMGQFPMLLSVRWYHSPPHEHKLGSAAALAAICAETNGEFVPLHSKLFEFADSLATWQMSRFANEASLRNVESIEDCISSQKADEVLGEHRALALAARAIGTPTIVVDSAVFLGMNRGLR